jgi:hypothetical protein
VINYVLGRENSYAAWGIDRAGLSGKFAQNTAMRTRASQQALAGWIRTGTAQVQE